MAEIGLREISASPLELENMIEVGSPVEVFTTNGWPVYTTNNGTKFEDLAKPDGATAYTVTPSGKGVSGNHQGLEIAEIRFYKKDTQTSRVPAL